MHIYADMHACMSSVIKGIDYRVSGLLKALFDTRSNLLASQKLALVNQTGGLIF